MLNIRIIIPERMTNMRKRIFQIIEISKEGDVISKVYDIFMMLVIVASLVPLAFKEEYTAFVIIDKVAVTIFIIDYLLRWLTADFKVNKGKKSFLLYPFTVMAIIDIISILPSLTVLNAGFKTLRLFRMIRTFRVLRVFKTVRYSKNIQIIMSVLRKSKGPLLAVGTLAVGYIIVAALVIFNVEPDSFDTLFDAIYWATVSLTTMGYGDIYPVTMAGRMITMLSSFIGIAIVALPAGIITAGYMSEIEKKEEEKKSN